MSLPVCNSLHMPVFAHEGSRLVGWRRSTARNPVVLPSSGGRHGYVNSHKSRCMAALKIFNHKKLVRRSANYQPSIWSNDYIQSMKSNYSGEANAKHINKLKEDVRKMFKKGEEEPLNQLELIDLLERLGISYHFEDEIGNNLEKIAYRYSEVTHSGHKDLYAASLEFRLLRQHGYDVTSDVFQAFKDDKTGNFKASIVEDCNGLLHLYEASFLAVEGESILEEARSLSRKYLEEHTKQKKNCTSYFSLLVTHALELPLHWRMPRMEARWFIDVYEQCQNVNPILLDFAKLDFNIVQATHQQDLKFTSRWWMDTRLGTNLGFIRDRLTENFLWTIGFLYEPQYGYFRRMLTQLNALITTIDDIYDVYGTLDELQLFTNIVARWDINELDGLPNYMKMCFFALHNSTNEMAGQVFKEKGVNILPFIKKAWTDLCETYLVEAKWYNRGHVPTMQQYIDNAAISIAAPLILCYAYALLSHPLTKSTFDNFDQYSLTCHCSSLVLRFANDLETSSAELKRGDIKKSVECYMHDTGCCEEEAREHVRGLIDTAWQKMNREILKLPLSSLPNKTFQRMALNVARTSQFMYQHGDGHSSQDFATQNRILLLLAKPIEVD